MKNDICVNILVRAKRLARELAKPRVVERFSYTVAVKADPDGNEKKLTTVTKKKETELWRLVAALLVVITFLRSFFK